MQNKKPIIYGTAIGCLSGCGPDQETSTARKSGPKTELIFGRLWWCG